MPFFQDDGSNTTTLFWFADTGLEKTFKELDQDYNMTLVFLVFSVILSFWTCASTAIKIKKGTKNYLPLAPKLILALRYWILSIIRVGCIVTYQSPYIGLLGMNNHHQAEIFPLDPEIFKRINATESQLYHYWNPIIDEFQNITISKLFRSDYSDKDYPKSPNSNIYTVISYGTGFKIFWICYLIYAILIGLMKLCINENFRKSSFGQKLQHIGAFYLTRFVLFI